MREVEYHDRGQNWIVCPDCRRNEAGIIHWFLDNEIILVCPDCDKKEWEVEATGKTMIEEKYK